MIDYLIITNIAMLTPRDLDAINLGFALLFLGMMVLVPIGGIALLIRHIIRCGDPPSKRSPRKARVRKKRNPSSVFAKSNSGYQSSQPDQVSSEVRQLIGEWKELRER